MMPQIKLKKLVDNIINASSSDRVNHKQLQSHVNEFAGFAKSLPPPVLKCTLPHLITPFLALHSKWDEYIQFPDDLKISILNIVKEILSKTKLDNKLGLHMLLDILLKLLIESKTIDSLIVYSEEHKIAILSCLETLFTAIDWDLYPTFYTDEQIPKLSMLVYSCLELARREKNKTLRLSALRCILKAAKIDDKSDLDDVVLLSTIGSMFINILPGIASCLIVIAVDDDKCGHKITVACIKAWARLVSIIFRCYNPLEEQPKLENLIDHVGDGNKVNNSIHDKKLALCANMLMKLTAHDYGKVKQELAESSALLIKTCFRTLPMTIPNIVEILIVLCQDSDPNIAKLATSALTQTSSNLACDLHKYRGLIDNLENTFHQHLMQLPRIFNGIKEGEKLSAINLLAGYLHLFIESDKLKTVLIQENSLNKLIWCLLYIAQINKSDVCLLEEYTLHDWKETSDTRTPWKRFKFDDPRIQEGLTKTCRCLAEPIVVYIVLEQLLEVYHNDAERKAEATIIINEIMSVRQEKRCKQMIDLYLDESNWNLPLCVEDKIVMKTVQNNIVQLCLQMEGLGKMALASGKPFRKHTLKILYVVLEKAGSAHPLLQAAGLACTANICKACGYASLTDFINQNADYFAYHVTNRLRRSASANVANTLSVVMKHSTVEIMPGILNVLEEVLLQSCYKFQEQHAVAYLQVFAAFVKAARSWLHVEVVVEPVVSKKERNDKLEEMRRLHLEELSKPVDMSDEIMGKTAEELYEEDMQMRKEEMAHEESPPEEYVKPPSPKYIKLVVCIIERSLHFIPSKNVHCKILVLEICISGVELLKDYEDELLPIVHKLWSPLVNRFKDIHAPLVVNLSFDLLTTLGRLSKDFIRMRTVKEVLPAINNVLLKQSWASYLKDKGAAYRYTQGYKMQLNILTGIGRLAYDLELDDRICFVFEGTEAYLSSKQPVPLQEAAINFYKFLYNYDSEFGQQVICNLGNQNNEEWKRNVDILQTLLK